MKRRGWIIGALIAILIFLFLCLGALALVLVAMGGAETIPITRGNSVAVIHIEGIIATSSEGGLLVSTASSPESIIKQIRRANKDKRVAAILLRIDSPGGSAAASQEIYREVKRSKKPVVASIGDVGASGGYYIASAAKEIIASPASLVGSIGVIVSVPNFEELYRKLGISFVTITQGKYKDIGNPARPMTEEEKRILTEQTAIIYKQFINDVAAGRGLPKEKVRQLANGLAFPASQARELGLVDRLGNYQDAVNRAGKLGKIKGEPEIIRYDKPTLWDLLGQGLNEIKAFRWWNEGLKSLGGETLPGKQPIPR